MIDAKPEPSDIAHRAKAHIASFGEWPQGVVRLGVVICVALSAAIVPAALIDALRGNDSWADRYASLGYTERSVPSDEAVGSHKVAEDARLWMPEDASYRIVSAPDLSGPLEWAAPDFLANFLLPRRQTDSHDAEWIFCYRCDTTELGDGFETLSDGGDGILFGRMKR